jgi:hypothetical protein
MGIERKCKLSCVNLGNELGYIFWDWNKRQNHGFILNGFILNGFTMNGFTMNGGYAL